MTEFHFLRPWWLVAIVPLLILVIYLWRQRTQLQSWAAICDKHLLEHLQLSKRTNNRHFAVLLLAISALCMIVALSGPTWVRLPAPTYKQIQPRVLVLDMSDAMMENDLTPNRLSRAKFKLHDLFKRRDIGQLGLVVYTGEPFIVSPLTDDAQTIDTLLTALTPEIMPVEGHQLDTALEEAGQLIKQAGFQHGQILVLTAETPSIAAIAAAKTLAAKQITSSIMPVQADTNFNPLFQEFATAGQGQLLPFSNDASDLDQWLRINSDGQFHQNRQDDIALWRDEGRWFLLPALVLLLPVFRRGWLQRVDA